MSSQSPLQRRIILQQENLTTGPEGHVIDGHSRNPNKGRAPFNVIHHRLTILTSLFAGRGMASTTMLAWGLRVRRVAVNHFALRDRIRNSRHGF
jgi:hypothetical protein